MSESIKRWRAWAVEHNSHGPLLDTLVFLPEGENPDIRAAVWVRLPWLDQPLSMTAFHERLSKESQALLEEGLADGRAGRVSEFRSTDVEFLCALAADLVVTPEQQKKWGEAPERLLRIAEILVEATEGKPMPPVRPACAWNDLGGCDDERVPVTFKHEKDVPRHLCNRHHGSWWANGEKDRVGQLSNVQESGFAYVACNGCGKPLGSKYYQGVPGRGNLCLACHEVAFPPTLFPAGSC